jgi:hypothetical protein
MRYTRKNKKGGLDLDVLHVSYNSDLHLVISSILDIIKELDVLTKYQTPSDTIKKINDLLSVLNQICNKMIIEGHEIVPIIPGSDTFLIHRSAVPMSIEKKNKIIELVKELIK